MRLLSLLPLVALAACGADSQQRVDAALGSVPGQLFCRIQAAGGGLEVVRLVAITTSVAAPSGAPLAVIATGATSAFVDDQCRRVGGVPTVPPADPAAAPVKVVPAA